MPPERGFRVARGLLRNLAIGLVALLAVAPARAQDGPAARERVDAKVSVASEPAGASVWILPRDPLVLHGLDREHLAGRTPLETRVEPGPIDVVVVKDGYVIKVEPLDLRAGAASR